MLLRRRNIPTYNAEAWFPRMLLIVVRTVSPASV